MASYKVFKPVPSSSQQLPIKLEEQIYNFVQTGLLSLKQRRDKGTDIGVIFAERVKIDDYVNGPATSDAYVVPQGKRLVIPYFTLCGYEIGGVGLQFVYLSIGGTKIARLPLIAVDDCKQIVVNPPTALVLEQGETLVLGAELGAEGWFSCLAYLIDAI